MEELLTLQLQTSQGPFAQEDLDPDLQLINQDKELRDVIRQDIDRTVQDNEFFTRDSVKDQLMNILYLWAKDNNDFGYR